MSPSSIHTLRRDGVDITYRRVGAGPPLLLLHATLSSSRQLRPLATRLAGRFDVVSIDRRGSGETEATAARQGTGSAGPIGVSVHLADLQAITASLWADPPIVVGHSYGGCIALELAARHPDAVRAVWVYEPPYAWVGPPDVRDAMAAVASATERAANEYGPGAAAEAFLAGVSGPASLRDLSPAARDRVHQAGPAAIADAALIGMDPDRLADITCPVVVACGAACRPVYARIAAGLLERIATARAVTIEDADHMAPIRRPDAIAHAVEELADR